MLPAYLTLARNKHDDYTGRPIQLRHRSERVNDRTRAPAVIDNGRSRKWMLSSYQRRKGHETGYRMRLPAQVTDFTDRPLSDLLLHLKITVRDNAVPHASYNFAARSQLTDLIVQLHNLNYLNDTVVVTPDYDDVLEAQLRTDFREVDYSREPTENARLGNFRRSMPSVDSSLDMGTHIFDQHKVVLVGSKAFASAVIDQGACYHYRALIVVINADASNFADGDILLEGARYISSQIMFIETNPFDVYKGKQRDIG